MLGSPARIKLKSIHMVGQPCKSNSKLGGAYSLE